MNRARIVAPLARVLLLCLFGALSLISSCHNLRSVFHEGGIYFVDADCYSRMTRARLVSDQPGVALRYHSFENHPTGTNPHTTVPMDYLIAATHQVLKHTATWAFSVAPRFWEERFLKMAMSTDEGAKDRARLVWTAVRNPFDFAGAMVSPLLGVATCLFLGWWARGSALLGVALAERRPLQFWAACPLFFATSPVVAHGLALGRPDHQSAVLACLAVALASEARLVIRPTRGWAAVSGAAWAAGLWVSLYEPLVLLLAMVALWLVFKPRGLWARERWLGWGIFAGLLLVAWGIEGWRILQRPDPALRTFLLNWSRSIGELAHLDLRSTRLSHWLGWSWMLAPVLLGVAGRFDRRAWAMAGFLAVTFALTCWQIRWGYFLALCFSMTLPWQLAALRRAWIAWPLFAISLFPLMVEWDQKLFPNDAAQRQAALRRSELQQLRVVSERMRAESGAHDGGFIAPWWLSPAVAYWSGQPGVAGSSHQSIAGTVDASRFYLASDAADAAQILSRRKVSWVLADDASRAIGVSASILGVEPPAECMATVLADDPREAPPFLHEIAIDGAPVPNSRTAQPAVNIPVQTFSTGPQFYRLYRVDASALVP